MSTDNDVLNSEDEIVDYSGDGVQAKEVVVTIVRFDRAEAGTKGGIRREIEFSGEDLPFNVTVKEWESHPNETAQRIGRSKIKQIVSKATGMTTAPKSLIVGASLKATLGEDDQGFVTLSRFKSLDA